jgi:putative membrane protein
MYIVYLTLMLTNLSAAFFILAWYVWRGLPCGDKKAWVPAFVVPGSVALLTGLHMTFTWPMPGVYNMAFGEPSIMVGVLFLAGSWGIAKCWDFTPLAIYAFIAGIAAMIIGIQFIHLNISQEPLAAGVGLLMSGFAGVLTLPVTFFWSRIKPLGRFFQIILVLLLVVAAVLWAYTAYATYWDHMASFGSWKPIYAR